MTRTTISFTREGMHWASRTASRMPWFSVERFSYTPIET
jgi:hypothetical protein